MIISNVLCISGDIIAMKINFCTRYRQRTKKQALMQNAKNTAETPNKLISKSNNSDTFSLILICMLMLKYTCPACNKKFRFSTRKTKKILFSNMQK